MNLPMVASNKDTRYESYMVSTINSTNYIGFQVLTFAESSLSGNLVRLCGNAIKIAFSPPFAVSENSDVEYFLRI